MGVSGGLFSLVLIGLWIFCFVDVLFTPESQCRNLPKLAWVFIVLLLFTIGSVLWLVAGRPWDRTKVNAERAPRAAAGGRRQASPGRRAPSNPDDDDEFLAGLKRRAEEQRRARERRERGDDPA